MASRWTFLTSHALVFLHIVRNPEATIKEISDQVGLSERAICAVLADLRDDGYVTVQKRRRSNVYTVNTDLSMRWPSLAPYSVRDFFIPLEEDLNPSDGQMDGVALRRDVAPGGSGKQAARRP